MMNYKQIKHVLEGMVKELERLNQMFSKVVEVVHKCNISLPNTFNEFNNILSGYLKIKLMISTLKTGVDNENFRDALTAFDKDIEELYTDLSAFPVAAIERIFNDGNAEWATVEADRIQGMVWDVLDSVPELFEHYRPVIEYDD